MFHPLPEADRKPKVHKTKILKHQPVFLSYLTKRCEFYLLHLAVFGFFIQKYLLKKSYSGSGTVGTVLDKTYDTDVNHLYANHFPFSSELVINFYAKKKQQRIGFILYFLTTLTLVVQLSKFLCFHKLKCRNKIKLYRIIFSFLITNS